MISRVCLTKRINLALMLDFNNRDYACIAIISIYSLPDPAVKEWNNATVAKIHV
jgi:hypothetical protein